MRNLGRLDRKIKIQAPTESRDAGGGVVQTFSDVAEVWAEVRPVTSSERFATEAIHSARASVFRVHFINDLSSKCRILYDGLVFEIKGIAEIGRRVGLEITGEAIE